MEFWGVLDDARPQVELDITGGGGRQRSQATFAVLMVELLSYTVNQTARFDQLLTAAASPADNW